MTDLRYIGIGQQRKERPQVERRRQRVDQYRFIIGSDLDETKLGPISGLAQKFRVDGHEVKSGSSLAKCGQSVGCGHQVHAGVRPKRYNNFLTGGTGALHNRFVQQCKSVSLAAAKRTGSLAGSP